MKIILSRKGLDSGFKGAKPSPILPCGRLLSLPIPVTPKQMEEKDEDGIPYADLRFNGKSIRKIIDPLHKYKFNYSKAHLDPDIDRDRLENRGQDWRPTFGQQRRAQAHLKDVKKGDLFLFFGRFRRTRYKNGKLEYLPPKKDGKDMHVIFGWLQVGKTLGVNGDEIPDWLHYHPHIVNRDRYDNNTIYIASDHLTLDGLSVRGAGTFPCFKPSLQLTVPGGPMSHWRLPKWFYPTRRKQPLSCHNNLERWEVDDDHAFLRSVPRGQEFIFDTKDYPEAIKWLNDLFESLPKG